jgi:hypothetical protein
MIAVLFVMTWMGGYVSGPIISVTEFTSVDRCEKAADVMRAQARAWEISDSKIRAFCVLK